MSKEIFVTIDNTSISVGDGWAVSYDKVVAAFVDYVEANIHECYPGHEVTVIASWNTTVDAATKEVEADLLRFIDWLWIRFVETEHEEYDLGLFARTAPDAPDNRGPGARGVRGARSGPEKGRRP
jgi:hypothetical protein